MTVAGIGIDGIDGIDQHARLGIVRRLDAEGQVEEDADRVLLFVGVDIDVAGLLINVDHFTDSKSMSKQSRGVEMLKVI